MNEPTDVTPKSDTPVTLDECRGAVERDIRDCEYLLFLLGWAVRELERMVKP